MEKQCNVCKEVLPIDRFVKHPSTSDRRQNQCTTCRNLIQIKYRNTKRGHSRTTVYEKTKKGFLVRVYRNMLSRVTGVQFRSGYVGLEILDKEDFYKWALKDPEFFKLFLVWEHNNYNRKLTPSIDRKDSFYGYTIDNIRWITHSENSRLGSLSRWSNKSN